MSHWLESWLPGLRIGRMYEREWLKRDLVAGAILGALLIPQGLAYAELAGLPQIMGLYATVMALVAYAVAGPSRYLVLGPDSTLGPMIAATVLPLAAGNAATATILAGALALMVGALCIAAGVAKLGFVADLISKPVRVGYLAGVAVTILISQLPTLFGIRMTDASEFVGMDGMGLLQKAVAFLGSLDQANPFSLGLGASCLALILVVQRVAPTRPAILVGIVGAMAATALLGLDAQGVDVVGVLPHGFPRPHLPIVPLSEAVLLAGAALGISLVAVGDTISTSAAFAGRSGSRLDSNQELVAIGCANVLSGFAHGFPISSSSSRTAVAVQAGAVTQLAGLVAAGLVVTVLVAAPGLVRMLPMSALAAVIIVASIRLFDAAELARLWRVRRIEFAMAAACFLGVVLVGVLPGIVVAVLLAMLIVFERAWRPYSAVLGRTAEIPGFHDVSRHPSARRIPGLLILRWDAPLFFANANIFRERIRTLVAAEDPTPYWVLVAAEPVTDIDVTASEMLVSLDAELNAQGIHLVFAEMKDPVKDTIIRYGLLESVARHHFLPTVDAAVEAFYAEAAQARPDLPAPGPRIPGRYAGQLDIADDFDAPLPGGGLDSA